MSTVIYIYTYTHVNCIYIYIYIYIFFFFLGERESVYRVGSHECRAGALETQGRAGMTIHLQRPSGGRIPSSSGNLSVFLSAFS